jgi:hypothetical protein
MLRISYGSRRRFLIFSVLILSFTEALREEQYAFNQEELRPYFSLPRVLQVRTEYRIS